MSGIGRVKGSTARPKSHSQGRAAIVGKRLKLWIGRGTRTTAAHEGDVSAFGLRAVETIRAVPGALHDAVKDVQGRAAVTCPGVALIRRDIGGERAVGDGHRPQTGEDCAANCGRVIVECAVDDGGRRCVAADGATGRALVAIKRTAFDQERS